MANTFKVKTKAGVGTSITTVYTVPSSTTTIVLGLIVGNVTGSAVNATVHVESDTSDTETNGNITGDFRHGVISRCCVINNGDYVRWFKEYQLVV
jgi:hypothetical protein